MSLRVELCSTWQSSSNITRLLRRFTPRNDKCFYCIAIDLKPPSLIGKVGVRYIPVRGKLLQKPFHPPTPFFNRWRSRNITSKPNLPPQQEGELLRNNFPFSIFNFPLKKVNYFFFAFSLLVLTDIRIDVPKNPNASRILFSR